MTQSKEPTPVEIKGNPLVCPICNNDKFRTRSTLMNTSGLSFLGMDWANKEANNYICSNCGYVYWFFNDPVEKRHNYV